MSGKLISYNGIQTHNLKNLSIKITPNTLTCICGASGSGKSSLVFDTIHGISKNEFNSLMDEDYENGDYIVESYENILFSVALKQLNFNINPRSTILTYFHLGDELSFALSKISPNFTKNAISINHKNMCKLCSGLGFEKKLNLECIIDKKTKIKDNPFLIWHNSYKDFYSQILMSYLKDLDIDENLTFDELNEIQKNKILYEKSNKKYKISYKIAGKTRVKTDFYRGVMLSEIDKINEKYTQKIICQKCGGSRLDDNINNIKIANFTLKDILLCDFSKLIQIINFLKNKYPYFKAKSLEHFIEKCNILGLGHLNLSRSIPSISGGELQRLRIVKILISKINNIAICLDEPTNSLHPSEIKNLTDEIEHLKHNNTIIAIEHNKELINKANNIYYLDKGEFISPKIDNYNGVLKNDFKSFASQKIKLSNLDFLKFSGYIEIKFGLLIGISSKSGIGKTSLLKYILPRQINSYKYISQKPIKCGINSTIATYCGILDDIKEIFHKNNDMSFKNLSCKKCGGSGKILVLEKYNRKFYHDCEDCSGSGFDKKTKEIKILDTSIFDILNQNIENLIQSNLPSKIMKKLNLLNELGLSHLNLNRKILEISGGESQRIKLFEALNDKRNKTIALDEPTKGLGNKDIIKILSLIYKTIKNEAKTFIVAEHNPLFLSYCNEIIELAKKGENVEAIFNSDIKSIKVCKDSLIKNWL